MMVGVDLAALLAVPALHGLLRRFPALGLAVGDLARTAMVGIVILHVLPHGWSELGPVALLLLVVGAVATLLAEHRLHAPLFGWTVAALGVHHLADGAGLALAETDPGLGAAVILHALPVGLVGYRLGLEQGGARYGWGVIAAICVATLLGFAGMQLGMTRSLEPLTGAVACLLAGGLLHAVTHLRHEEGPVAASGVGVALGLVLLVVLLMLDPGEAAPGGQPEPEQLDAPLATLCALGLASAPALLLSFALGGLWSALRPAPAPRPGLIGQLAAPELGLPSLLVSFPLLGSLAALRALVWAAAALLERPRLAPVARKGPWPDWERGWRVASRELPDQTLPWFAVGLAIAATFSPLLDPSALLTLPSWILAPLFALLAVPVLGGAATSTPIVALLLQKGVPLGAAAAFLFGGRAAAVLLPAAWRGELPWGRALALLLGLVGLAGTAGALLPGRGGEGAAQEISLLGHVSALLVLLLGLSTLLRLGMTGCLQSLTRLALPPGREDGSGGARPR
jgi:uncharacterized membrane protein YraQ (UPF0718 family)